jgi:CubicO group peptidase (beta-lactamase class C family)
MKFKVSARNLVIVLLLTLFTLQPAMSEARNPESRETNKSVRYTFEETEQFMTSWFVLGPIPVSRTKIDPEDTETQKKAFAKDQLNPAKIKNIEAGKIQKINGIEYQWKLLESEGDIIDFQKIYGDTDFVAAYAWAEIKASEEKTALFGFASDDGIKVWLNGKLVHENWIGRAVSKDDDLVPLKLKKGANRILLKIQDMQQDWAFACRRINSAVFPEKLIASSVTGDLDNLKMLISHGADVNATMDPGITAIHAAKIHGREEVVKFLIEQGANPDIEMPDTEQLTEALIDRIKKESFPGAAVLVSRDGKLLYSKGFGLADLAHQVPITPETKFRIGSITKQFTAASILKLQEEGLLNVEDKLSKYIADFPRGDEVTIDRLLTHSSGIHSFTNQPNFLDRVRSEITPEEMVDSIKSYAYDFDPGEKYQYNNSGYFLLGYIVEKVSGKNFAEYLQETFFDPIGMKNSGIHNWYTILEHEATGYSFVNGELRKSMNWDMSHAGGAGAIYSTVGDLYLWNEAVFNGKVLSDKSLQAAFTPAKLNDGSPATPGVGGYGYGWGIGEFRGLKIISHGGGLHGFLSYLVRFPEKNCTIAVLSNAFPPTGFTPNGLTFELAPIYLWEEMEAQKSFATDENVNTDLFDIYTGRYEYPQGMIMTITKEDDRLFAQMVGQPKFEIFPKSENEFFWKVVDAQIVFHKNDDGEITHAMHYQGGQELKVPRLAEEVVAEVDPSGYDIYIGEYKLNQAAIITVTKENNKLFVQLTGQPKFEIFPRSETEFFLKVVKADVNFKKDEAGIVTGLTLIQGGVSQNAPKIK